VAPFPQFALTPILLAADAQSPLGTGWLVTLLVAFPTAIFGVLAYRAQRSRDEYTRHVEEQRQEKAREAEARAADNDRLKMLQETQDTTLAQLKEDLASVRIEVTRMYAVERETHARETALIQELEACGAARRALDSDRDLLRQQNTQLRVQLDVIRADLQRCRGE
jgi:hypothetical protein